MEESKLANVKQSLEDSLKNQHCGFIDGVGDVYAVSEETIKDALELLKEQMEKVEPISDGRIWLCGNCKEFVGFEDHDDDDPNEFDIYCRNCGKKVKWKPTQYEPDKKGWQYGHRNLGS